ncbi:hypothetical protein EX30DRAFT_207464 [Ascodesmis nigricans]|uniref:Uncharacterized protein n=1 Tax=Ascodesmis nigricans TaxID=341454 RepID=A0A4S2MJV6_9PEZI|nr:hypothetical protein EX30DRAFT_207464 [Ascodesmis nigricans]
MERKNMKLRRFGWLWSNAAPPPSRLLRSDSISQHAHTVPDSEQQSIQDNPQEQKTQQKISQNKNDTTFNIKKILQTRSTDKTLRNSTPKKKKKKNKKKQRKLQPSAQR